MEDPARERKARRQTSRVRASPKALAITLKALKDAGIPVMKVVVEGPMVEIHCGAPGAGEQPKRDDGLKPW